MDLEDVKSLTEMSGAEFDELRKKTNAVIVVSGSTERHGPHLALGTDSLVGYEVAKRTVKRLAEEGVTVALAPLIHYGESRLHSKQAGTISIRSQVLIELIKDIGVCLASWGLKKQFYILSHDGNIAAATIATRDIYDATGADTYVWRFPDTWTITRQPEILQLLKSDLKFESHGGETETAQVLAINPNYADMKNAVKHQSDEVIKGRDWPLVVWTLNPDNPLASHPLGFSGDPTLATKETGEKLYELGYVPPLVKFIKEKLEK